MTTTLTDDGLAPLAHVIRETLRTTQYRLGQPIDDLVACITVRVAVYMGRQVDGVTEQLAQLAASRKVLHEWSHHAQSAQTRQLFGELHDALGGAS